MDLVVLLLAFLTMKPQVTNCVFMESQQEIPEAACNLDNICADDSPVIHYEIDWSKESSLHNWVEKFELIC